ncbi:MAG: pyridoxamine 5'-phosphate oxidase family protein [Firmicutes bacterium]|nr:pyridoxamine 5'-phosphate oxidase family protein [Bacillota bacterium]
MDLIKEAEELLGKCMELAVSSITEDGYPRICVLVKVRAEGCKTIYFATGTSSKKVAHYKANPKAGVTFYNQFDSVAMLGKMSVLTDKAEKDSFWQDWMAPHFPDGGKDDPEFAVICFNAEEATIYIKHHFETVKL